eukprot:CAMPEP_0170499302 /NCGR_PEP_ID=MMETSP0208-20121228/30907_1 /TAXON_ID=197538 /ORGANISM="Strombidium inclinatum, Strain S3" /LENGTH=69 /DNA_ID=CAMNT_0010776811 /DNA_START=668 /DNA_END=877 /DNA_ORIENTATION=+
MASGKAKLPLVVYPEGAASNGDFLTSFKSGTFKSLAPVKPFVLKYSGSKSVCQTGMNLYTNAYLFMASN